MAADFRTRLVSELTSMDRRASKRPGYNPYALAQYLEAADGVVDAESFADRFTPSRPMHTVARRLRLGLDVDRGRWVLVDQSALWEALRADTLEFNRPRVTNRRKAELIATATRLRRALGRIGWPAQFVADCETGREPWPIT